MARLRPRAQAGSAFCPRGRSWFLGMSSATMLSAGWTITAMPIRSEVVAADGALEAEGPGGVGFLSAWEVAVFGDELGDHAERGLDHHGDADPIGSSGRRWRA